MSDAPSTSHATTTGAMPATLHGSGVAGGELADAVDRRLIRDALDETLVVEAAAGTGKTTELVARIVRLVATEQAQIDQIVAVTFTEKAAGELKLRIREELEKARRKNGDTPAADATRRAIEHALQHLEEAHVSTIHGFCADLLRERPVEAAVDPGFEVLTEPQAEALFDRAFRDWFQEQLERPGEGVRRALRRLPSAWSPYAEDEDGPVERLRRAARDLLEWRDLRAPWRREPFDRDGEVRRCLDALCAFADLTERPSWKDDPLHATTAVFRRLAADIRRAGHDTPDARDEDGWEAALVRISREFRDIRTGRKADYGHGVTRADVLAARDALQASLDAFTRAANADLAARLQQELLACVDRYDELKTNAGALDFLDLLLRARALVRDCAPVRRAFQDRFRFILVDEFQDTDPLQAEILLLLAAREDGASSGGVPDWRQVPIRRGALFLVGDPKQSIYRFRRADVGIYQEVCDLLVRRHGARAVHLATNFRTVPSLQRAINAAFATEMTRDDESLQADYVPLRPFRRDLRLEGTAADGPARHGSSSPAQPSLVALPVPDPYGRRNIAAASIEDSLPDAVGAWVHWLLTDSGWTVTERRGGQSVTVPVEARHVCILFRRFVKFQDDMTRPYVNALEARGIPHLLVGGRSFHDREEVETLRAALAAIEWPEDALSVYATLRGALFALGEETLLAYWHAHPRRRFHPYDVPDDLPAELRPVGDALGLLRTLHARRNHRPAAETLGQLLEHTRAHVTFVMRPAGERVLANVLQVVELARQYEADGGISFRGFVDALREAADRSEAPEAPVVEEGSDGVRLMTVHKAKGLEFPVVVLADMTCRLSRADATRHIDQVRGLAAMQLLGCAPHDLLDHADLEARRERAEGIRLAYVAATRARDVLVVPAIGDGPYDGWFGVLNRAIYPPVDARREALAAPGCPPLGKDTVRFRPEDNPGMRADTVRPGRYELASGVSGGDAAALTPAETLSRTLDSALGVSAEDDGDGVYPVVWWSPGALSLDADPPFGVRRDDLIAKDAAPAVVSAARTAYDTWALERSTVVSEGSVPSVQLRTVSEFAHSGAWPTGIRELPRVEVVHLPRDGIRPSGRRFGTLVHAVLATVPLAADRAAVGAVATLEGRILGAPDTEVGAAADLAARVLAHPLLAAARVAEAAGRCRREVPVTLTLDDGRLLEGVVDLAYEGSDAWVVIDFKTDDDPARELEAYSRQVALYAAALANALEASPNGVVFVV